jgi:ATP synthase protein I
MTTESPRTAPTGGGSALLGAALVALVAGLLLALLGAIVGGSPAAYGALVGTLVVVAVFALGAGVVHVAAGLVPAASLLVALLTYTLQVLLLAVVFLAIERSGLADDALDRRWLSGAVIVGTLAWIVTQIVLATRLRLPAYDLGDRDVHDRPEASAR